MGWIKNSKVNLVTDEARNARAAGRHVYACKFSYPAMKTNLTLEIEDWSLMIDAIEAEGWRLEHFTGGAGSDALCVFRSVDAPGRPG